MILVNSTSQKTFQADLSKNSKQDIDLLNRCNTFSEVIRRSIDLSRTQKKDLAEFMSYDVHKKRDAVLKETEIMASQIFEIAEREIPSSALSQEQYEAWIIAKENLEDIQDLIQYNKKYLDMDAEELAKDLDDRSITNKAIIKKTRDSHIKVETEVIRIRDKNNLAILELQETTKLTKESLELFSEIRDKIQTNSKKISKLKIKR